MKKVVIASLVSAYVAAPAMAYERNDDRRTAQSRESADNLGVVGRNSLRAQKVLAEIALFEIQRKQSLMDMVGAEHDHTPYTIAIGTALPAVEVALAALAYKKMPESRFSVIDKEIRQKNKAMKEELAGLKAANKSKKEGEKLAEGAAEQAAETGAATAATAEGQAEAAAQNIAKTAEERKIAAQNLRAEIDAKVTANRWLKAERNTIKFGIGYVVPGLLAYEAGETFVQMVIAPAQFDEYAARLSSFIDDANRQLDNK